MLQPVVSLLLSISMVFIHYHDLYVVYATFFGRKAAFASVAGEKVSEDRLTGDSAPGIFST